MRFEVTSHEPLKGETSLPGDRLTTLLMMALASASGSRLVVRNPSPSPDVASLWAWLGSAGIMIISNDEELIVDGGSFSSTLTVNDTVPSDILHVIISSAVFSGRRVTVTDIDERRKEIVHTLSRLFESAGLMKNGISAEDDHIIFESGGFDPDKLIQLESAWAAESVLAAALASGSTLRLSAPAPVLSHVSSFMEFFGYRMSAENAADSRDIEIARRLAKAEGKPQPDVRLFEKSGKAAGEITVPGDTLFAAALVSAAAVQQKSKLVLRSVLWDQTRRGFFETVRRMKGNIDYETSRRKKSFDTADITISWGPLESVHVTAEQARSFSAELLMLGALGACASGETVISDIAGADCPGLGRERFMMLARGLEILGAHVGDYADGIVIKGGSELRGNLVDSNKVPELALAFHVLGMYSSGMTTVFGFKDHSYPVYEFKNLLESLK